MKNKIKVEFNEKKIYDEEIDQFKDFDKLLDAKANIEKTGNYAIWITGLVIISGIALLFLFDLEGDSFKTSTAKLPAIETGVIEKVEIIENLPVQEKTVNEQKISKGANEMVTPEEPENKTNPIADALHDQDSGKNEKQKISNNAPTKISTSTNEFVDAYPKEGFTALYDYFERELKYPDKAVQEKITGTVLVEFTISQSGAIEKIKIIKSLDPELDQEAIRLISKMPTWIPATYGSETFASKQTLPLTFQIK